MDMREQDTEIEMPLPTTLVYNLPNRDSSSSKLSSPTLATTVVETSDLRPAQTHTLIFSDQPQTSVHDHHLYPPSPLPPNPLQLQQQHRPRRNPDPSSSSSPIATTSITRAAITPPQPQPQTTGTTISTPSIRYLECLKNHAAKIGGHVIDGCGEFMPSGEEGTPESMTCAACECHRNFHRKEAKGEQPQHVFNYHSHRYYPNKSNGLNRIHLPHHQATHLRFPTPHSSSLHQHHRFSLYGGATAPSARLIQPMMMAFGGSNGGLAESSNEDLNMFQSDDHGGQLSVQPSPPLSKKRFRTKFTQQQKDRMTEFAEKLGWKIQKQDEQEVHQFCSQVGVTRQVFKVWMHNSKQSMKRKQMEG